MRRRVVITGLGPITCIGKGVEGFWNGILAEKTGITKIDNLDVSQFGVRVAGQVNNWDPEEFFPPHRLEASRSLRAVFGRFGEARAR